MGTFAKVYECLDTQTQSTVALKVVRAIRKYNESAKIEGDILQTVHACMKQNRGGSDRPSDRPSQYHNHHNIVRFQGQFEADGHRCLVSHSVLRGFEGVECLITSCSSLLSSLLSLPQRPVGTPSPCPFPVPSLSLPCPFPAPSLPPLRSPCPLSPR